MHPNVLAALERAEKSWKLVSHASLSSEIRGPQDFATALGWSVDRITKTLFVKSHDGESFAMIVCPATSKVDFHLVQLALGARYEVASRDELSRVVGYPSNGVTPLGAPTNIPVLVDEDLLDFETVMTGAGAVGEEIEISVSDLLLITSAQSTPVSKNSR
jgi:Cys-tRNA(Pro)/Cys-tRNA(Cys) deacylase